MKKLLCVALLAVSTLTIASEPVITFAGKQITPKDNQTTLIAKLGKPTSGNTTYSYWEKPNYSISASYGQRGLSKFGISQMNNKPSTTSIKTRGQTITIGKDTLKTAIGKLKEGCFDILDTQYNSTYSFRVMDGSLHNLNVQMSSEYVKKNKATSMNRPVFSLGWDEEYSTPSEGCNYGL
ncbi:hypothetical protein BEN71_03750 [Acinetobacter wuhouensis]|uniref:hypothetical protein n=1 Tax=Acinetobacter wuhouensis TaxID=1879050 RepID=UPI00083B73F4|nr:hypothetical protein [Acinetobacter wuhouensis]AXQ21257.1 hypothetical protein BEN71_03750 [Acinetobacter wuhouensis]